MYLPDTDVVSALQPDTILTEAFGRHAAPIFERRCWRRGSYGYDLHPKREGTTMTAKRVFISFDYDHDNDLKNALVGQSKYPNSPFNIADWSVKDPIPGNWKQKVRSRISRVDLVAVICGHHTHTASGVAEEIRIACEEGKPYFLLKGRKSGTCTKPRAALDGDKMNQWTWDNLRKQIEGKNILDYAVESLPLFLAGVGLVLWIRSRERGAQSRWS